MLGRTMTWMGVAVAVALVGCDDAGGMAGEAPAIADLALDDATMPVGRAAQVSGRLAFSDPDGDVAALVAEIRAPGVAPVRTPSTPVANAGGLLAGQVPFSLALMVPSAGTVELDVWLVDAEGNVSNALTGEIVAE